MGNAGFAHTAHGVGSVWAEAIGDGDRTERL